MAKAPVQGRAAWLTLRKFLRAEVGVVDASTMLASVEDRAVDEAVAALAKRHGTHDDLPGPRERRRNMRQLFGLVLRCVRQGCAEPIIEPSEQIAAYCYAAGTDLAEVQAEFNVLAEVLCRYVAGSLVGDQRVRALGLVNAVVGAGKDSLGCTYVALASRSGSRPAEELALPGEDNEAVAGSGGEPDGPGAGVVQATVVGRVGIVTLDDQRRRNAIGAQMADGVVAALRSLRDQDVRVIVLRAAPGMDIWSAGHNIHELPRGRRDPLGYDDPLEGLLRAVHHGDELRPDRRRRYGVVRHHPGEPGIAV